MGEWTNTKLNRQVEFHTNLLRTSVTISTLDGEYTCSVEELKRKLQSAYLLPAVRRMFQAMLDYVEGEQNV